MYLPLSGHDPDREKNRQKMSVNSVSPTRNPSIVQPPDPIDKTHQRTEKVENQPHALNFQKTASSEKENSNVVDHHYAPPSLSTQDFMTLRKQGSDDPFAVLDEVLERIKDKTEEMGEFISAMKKLAESADKDSVALQVLTKTLEAMDETNEKK
jgi:hypothetical protein